MNNSLFSLDSQALAEKLKSIRQMATRSQQSQQGGLLQSLLSEAMKTSPRGASVGGGSKGAMLPTPSVSLAMPRAQVPTKDKQEALKRGLNKFKKGQSAEERFKILVNEGVDQAVAKSVVGKMYRGEVIAENIAEERRSEQTQIRKEERAEKRTEKTKDDWVILSKKQVDDANLSDEYSHRKNKYTGKIESFAKKTVEKIDDTLSREKFEATEDQRRRKHVMSLFGASDFEALDPKLKEKVIDVTVKAKNYQKKDIDFDDAIQKSFSEHSITEAVDKLPEANLGYTDITSNEVETVELVKQLHDSGASNDDISTGLEKKGWPKTGNQSVDGIMKQIGIIESEESPVTEPYDANKANTIREQYRSGNIDKETAMKQLEEIGMPQ